MSSDLENHVAMTVTGLLTDTAEIIAMSRQPETADLIARDRDMIADAHEQLGRLLTRLPVQHKEAAE